MPPPVFLLYESFLAKTSKGLETGIFTPPTSPAQDKKLESPEFNIINGSTESDAWRQSVELNTKLKTLVSGFVLSITLYSAEKGVHASSDPGWEGSCSFQKTR